MYAQWELPGISASDIAKNPELYYGKTVNYSANGITGHGADSTGYIQGWKVFYADNDNIFLIASDYLPVEKLPSIQGLSKSGKYNVSWANNVAFQDEWSIYKESFMHTGFDLTEHKQNLNSRIVSSLMNTDNWVNFVDSDKADYAIGSPTLEMWIASWNDMHPNSQDEMYFSIDEQYWRGYKIGINGSNAGFVVNLKNKAGYKNILYFPHTHSSYDAHWNNAKGYYLASPASDDLSFNHGGQLYGVAATGNMYYTSYDGTDSFTLRPIVRLKSGVKLKFGTDGYDYDL